MQEHWELVNDLRQAARVLDIKRYRLQPAAEEGGEPAQVEYVFDSLWVDPNAYSTDMEIHVNEVYIVEAKLYAELKAIDFEHGEVLKAGARGLMLRKKRETEELTADEAVELGKCDERISAPDVPDLMNGSARARKVIELRRLIAELACEVILPSNPEWDAKRVGRLTKAEDDYVISFFVRQGSDQTAPLTLRLANLLSLQTLETLAPQAPSSSADRSPANGQH